jgi:hypothetical protein
VDDRWRDIKKVGVIGSGQMGTALRMWRLAGSTWCSTTFSPTG